MQSLNSFADFSNYVSLLIQQQNYKQAHFIIDQNLAQNKNNAMLWHLKSIISFSQQDFINAELQTKRAIKLQPNLTAAISNLAKLKKQQRNYAEAVKLLEQAITFEPQNAQYLHELAIVYNLAGNYDASLSLCERLLEKYQRNINVLITKSQALLKLDKFEEVIYVTNQILKQDEANISAINNKSIALKALCQWQEALTLLDKGLTLVEDHPTLLKNKASCLVLLGKHQQASEIYLALTKKEPEDLDSHHWLNLIYWEQAEENFLNSYEYAIKQQPKNISLYVEKSKKHILAKQYDQADEVLTKALNIEPNNIQLKLQLGVLKRETRQFDESFSLLNSAFKANDNALDISEEYAKTLLAIEDTRTALNIINKLLDKNEFQQGWLALKTTALKQLKSEEYHYLVNYDRDLLNCFINVPKGYKNLYDFNRDLEIALKEYHYAKQHPLDQSLVGGSQTSEKLFDYQLPIVQTLRAALREQTLDHISQLPKDLNHPMLKRLKNDFIETDSWSVLLNSKGFHKNHHHPAGWYSGPYYIHIPDVVNDSEAKQGWIKFGQPGFEMVNTMKPDIFVKPEEGKLAQFPSFYWHGTNPFEDENFRMCVAYDIIPK